MVFLKISAEDIQKILGIVAECPSKYGLPIYNILQNLPEVKAEEADK